MSFNNKKILTLIMLFFLRSQAFGLELKLNIDDKKSEEAVKELNDYYKKFSDQRFVLLQHRANYVIPLSYNNKPNNAPFDANLDTALLDERGDFVQPLEAEFQFSFKVLFNKGIFGTGLDGYIGYTHRAWWQLYNGSWSKPFRETNYAPEIFARKVFDQPKKLFGMYLSGYDLGYMHESNGQANELSRSWDRIYARGMWGTNVFRMVSTFWFRIPESSRRDQNPDILDFRGIAELELIYQPNKNEFRFILTPGFKRSGVEASYSYPIKRDFRIFTKINYGYGQSLIDFDHKIQRIGIGFTMEDPISNYFQKLREKQKTQME